MQQLWNNLHNLVSLTAAFINCFSSALTNAAGYFFHNALRAWGKTVLQVINLIFSPFFKAVITSADYFIIAVGRKLMNFTSALFWFGLDKCQVPTKSALSLRLLNWTGERRHNGRLEGRGKDRERSLTNYCHGQNRLNLGRQGSLIYHQSNQSRITGTKTRS